MRIPGYDKMKRQADSITSLRRREQQKEDLHYQPPAHLPVLSTVVISCHKSREAERVVIPEKTLPGKTLEERLERSVVQIKVRNS